MFRLVPVLIGLAAAAAACSPAEAPPVAVPVPAKTAADTAPDAVAVPADRDGQAARYLAIKDRYAALMPQDSAGPARILREEGPVLRQLAETAVDIPLRANASLLLGSLYEATGDRRTAISFYQQVSALLPEDAGPKRVLAVALAQDGQLAAAIEAQEFVVRDDPDDLEAWLLLGELAVKTDKTELATEAYAAYELRRKGLIDGISLKRADGTFPLAAEDRAACARALIPARDSGTAIALRYALEIETDPAVRVAIVEAMGTQRLVAYKPALTAKLAAETVQDVKDVMTWALAEIERDPLDARPNPTPPTTDAAGDGAGAAPAPKTEVSAQQ